MQARAANQGACICTSRIPNRTSISFVHNVRAQHSNTLPHSEVAGISIYVVQVDPPLSALHEFLLSRKPLQCWAGLEERRAHLHKGCEGTAGHKCKSGAGSTLHRCNCQVTERLEGSKELRSSCLHGWCLIMARPCQYTLSSQRHCNMCWLSVAEDARSGRAPFKLFFKTNCGRTDVCNHLRSVQQRIHQRVYKRSTKQSLHYRDDCQPTQFCPASLL